MSFAGSLKAELLKTKRSAAFWLSVFGAAFIPVLFFFIYFFKAKAFIPRLKNDPWQAHFVNGWETLSVFLLPLYIILICSLILQIEYKSNTWKQVFASPQSVRTIFFSKFLTIHILILFCFILFNLFMIGSAFAVNLFNKDYPFFSHPIDWAYLLRSSFKTYVSILGISAIQYWASLRFKNFIIPIGIGLALLIMAIVILQWEHISKVPYAHPILTFLEIQKKRTALLVNHEWNSIGYFFVFTTLVFLDMQYRKERG